MKPKKPFTVVLSEEDKKLLDKLAKENDHPPAKMARLIIERAVRASKKELKN